LDVLPTCRRCKERPVRARKLHLCEPCAAAAGVRAKELHRLAARRRRERALDQERERKRDAWRRIQADPARRARMLETRRLRYRLRAQREGRKVRPLRRPEDRDRAFLPGHALALAIDRLAEGSELPLVCELAGIQQRLVFAWRSYERDVSRADADAVMTALDLLWWEVWTEEAVRVPAIVVRTYVRQRKKGVLRRVRLRAVPYGDLGPDEAKLAEIGVLMTGEALVAA
jgi:hypothetical protein